MEINFLPLKPSPADDKFLEWVKGARKHVCEALAIPLESMQIQRSPHVVTYDFEHPRVKGLKATVTVGYGVNGVLISRVSDDRRVSSRPVAEDQFYKSPFGTMLMEAQWFWRTRDE